MLHIKGKCSLWETGKKNKWDRGNMSITLLIMITSIVRWNQLSNHALHRGSIAKISKGRKDLGIFIVLSFGLFSSHSI